MEEIFRLIGMMGISFILFCILMVLSDKLREKKQKCRKDNKGVKDE